MTSAAKDFGAGFSAGPGEQGRMGVCRRALLLAAGSAVVGPGRRAAGQGRAETLRYAAAGVVNTLDPVMLGATPEATALSTAVYDRLLRFGRRAVAEGGFVFDFDKIEGELAERYELAADGRTITLHLRPGAAWHDGRPVTAADVKWSFDRAVAGPTMGKAQLATGSLTDPAQMTVAGTLCVEIRLARADRFALPNLATVYAPMFNSVLARQHATEADPWATAWLKENTAGGGAYVVQGGVGPQVSLLRNEGWTGGVRPHFRRAIVQTVPDATIRAALLEKGDADVAIGLQPEDLRQLAASAKARVISTPMPTGFAALIFNTRQPPFDRVEVRRALSLAVPYEAMFRAAIDGRGSRLFGAGWTGEPPAAGFPQPLPLRTDLAAARAMLADAGLGSGFETTLSYSLTRAAFAEPAAALIQEAFAAIGVAVRIEKLPEPQMAQAITEKRLPMLLERSFALFPSTEYFFRIFASGPSRWNFASWDDPAFDALLPQARYEADDARHDALARRLVGRFADQVPMATLWQPNYDVAVGRGLSGFTTWYNYYPDLRDLAVI